MLQQDSTSTFSCVHSVKFKFSSLTNDEYDLPTILGVEGPPLTNVLIVFALPYFYRVSKRDLVTTKCLQYSPGVLNYPYA